MKAASSKQPKGEIDIDVSTPLGDQLWYSSKGVLAKATEKMLLFEQFSVEEGNGLSPFARALMPKELIQFVVEYFQPAKRDLWGIVNTAAGAITDEESDDENRDDDECDIEHP